MSSRLYFSETADEEISGTYKTAGTWASSFVYDEIPVTGNHAPSYRFHTIKPPKAPLMVWDQVLGLTLGTLDLSSEDLEKLIDNIELHGEHLGKLHFILFDYDK